MPALVAALRPAGLLLAAAATLTGLTLIWIARLSADRYLYVSELGATGEPTAEVFRWAMTLVAGSAALVAVCAPRLEPRVRWLAVAPPAVVLGGAAVAFGIASQVTCTYGCPLPVGPAFTWQDLVHTVCAVIGFAGAAVVMLQVSVDRRFRGLGRYSAVSAIAVAVIAGAGGLLSLLRFGTQFGGILELVATTIALLWLAVLAVVLAISELRARRDGSEPRESDGGDLRDPDGPDLGDEQSAAAQSQPTNEATPARVASTYAE
ncbi:DUF998 domain-containing protein [Herbiconiux sp. P15]|uniref:DUF998 domain-containing protein n=1 Tax=Herbiconiux liukaitaii TaxID=3342799 RepID=UPI0035B7EF81